MGFWGQGKGSPSQVSPHCRDVLVPRRWLPAAPPCGFSAAWPQGQRGAGDPGREDEDGGGLKPALLWMGL